MYDNSQFTPAHHHATNRELIRQNFGSYGLDNLSYNKVNRRSADTSIIEIHSPGYISADNVSNIATHILSTRSPTHQATLEEIKTLLQSQPNTLRVA